MNKWMLLKTKSRVVTACGLVALAVTLAWANQAQAVGYPVGSEEALEASFFDPFSLTAVDSFSLTTADPFRSSMIRSVAPSSSTVATAVPTVSEASTAFVAVHQMVIIPRTPLVRSPSRVPQVRTPSRMPIN